MARPDRVSLVAALVATGAVVAAIALDVAIERDRRLAMMREDLAVVAVVLGEESRGAQSRVAEMAANPASINAAANGEFEYFAERLERLQSSVPGVRALHATNRSGRTVGLAGDELVRGLLESTRVSPLCAGGVAYQIIWAPLSRGLLAVAYDPAPALARAREATGGRVRVSLLERDGVSALSVDGVPPCAVLPEAPPYDDAAIGGRGLSFIDRAGDAVAVGYEPVEGTALELLVEEDRMRPLVEAAWRRLAIVGAGVITLGAFAAGRISGLRARAALRRPEVT